MVILLRHLFCAFAALQGTHAHRPDFVLEKLAKNEPLYYFGLGSNMLRSKLENRSFNGTIQLLSFEPAVVKNYRLAFNMRGFLPLEPGMGSLEPINHSQPLFAYEKPETHGALVQLTPENYEKVMNSEGVSMNNTQAGYEEIVVDAYPYGSSEPVRCIALRAREHVRLPRDPAPSLRYMRILRTGAAELGLESSYQQFLQQHPVQVVPKYIRPLAIHNLLFAFTMARLIKTRLISRMQSFLLFRTYIPSTGPPIGQLLHHLFTALVIFPGALIGFLLHGVYLALKIDPPPFWKRMKELMEEEEQVESTQSGSM